MSRETPIPHPFEDLETKQRIPVKKVDWIENAYSAVVDCDTPGETAIASALIAIALELKRLNDSRDAEYDEQVQREEIRERLENLWRGRYD